MVALSFNGALRVSSSSIRVPVPACASAYTRSTRRRANVRSIWTGRQQQRAHSSLSALAHAKTLGLHATRPSASPLPPTSGLRSYATASAHPLPNDIAVLGGGLTGLTTAFYLAHFHPNAKITIYEAADRLGGWVDTEHVEVKTQEGKTATITFERGARTVTPQTSANKWEDFVLFDLIDQLGFYTHPKAPYAVPAQDSILNNRYIYYPDHLMPIPSPPSPKKTALQKLSSIFGIGYQLLTEPALKGWFTAIKSLYENDVECKNKMLRENPKDPRRIAIADHEDISTGAFLENELGTSDLVNNFLSAMYHGVWGGDIWKLSAVETTLQTFFFQLQHYGLNMVPIKDHDYESGRDLVARNESVAPLSDLYGSKIGYIGFHNGFGTLTDALADALRDNANVTIKTSAPVTAIQYGPEDGKAVVTSSTAEKHKYDKVISSLYSGTLAKLTGPALPSLKSSTAVTIQIVNLWYPNPLLTARYPGFGYLIPQSVPAENNPHAALGVIFDSDREAAAGTPEYTSAPGTKLTVMLGGHYWDYLDPESWPDAEEAAAMAIDTVQRQLGIPANEPVFTSTKVCRECIPQHLVGHRARMAKAHSELYESFRGTLAVVGGSYTSPGVLPSLKAARDVALKTAGQGYINDDTGTMSNMAHVGETGLARFYGRNETFRLFPDNVLPFRKRSGKKVFDLKI